MAYTLKPEEVGVFAIGGLGKIPMGLNTKTKSSLWMLGSSSLKMIC